MSTARELLSAALDSNGWICVFVQKGDKQWNQFFPAGAYEKAARWAEQKDKEGFNCYFCTSTLATNENRKAENAAAVKLLKLDIDIAPDNPKKYPTREAARAGVKQFMLDVGMNFAPTIVSSGGGYHIYWFLSDAVDVVYGKWLQEAFKALTIHHGLKADPTITADIVRVLRLPGTHNHKDPANPREVVVQKAVVLHDVDTVCDWVETEFKKLPAGAAPAAPLFDGMDISHLQGEDDTTKSLAGSDPNKVLVFSKLLRMSLEGEGCAQIKRLWEGRAEATEPEWRDLLGFAAKAADRDKAIHAVSEAHDSYSPSLTEQKASQIPAPHNCAYFQSNEHAELCKKCKHAKKINSPVSLGMVTQRSTGADNIVVAQNKSVDAAPRQYTIPDLPPGYFRGKHGGIYRQAKTDGEDDVKLCHEDFYALANVMDGQDYMIELCVNTGKFDGVKQFLFPMGSVMGDGIKKVLPEKGVRPPYVAVGFAPLQQYINDFHVFLRDKQASLAVKHQFGWTDETYSSFVIGEREVKRLPNGDVVVEFSQPSDELQGLCDRFTRKGSLEAWRDTANVYNRSEFMAPHRFGVLLGFAGPLIPLLDLKGMVVNLYGEKSGHGKSTALETQATIWGAPTVMRSYQDTSASRLHTIGCYKNIPAGYDEMTKVPLDEMTSFLFQITTGQGKDRMEAQTNRLRVNNTNWATCVTITANTSFAELLTAQQAGGEGVLMRLLEVHFEEENRNLIDKVEADRVFSAIKHNYGHAGEMFIKHILTKGVDVVKAMLFEERSKLDMDTAMDNQERFWSGAIAAAYVGGLLAKEAGLIDYDMDAMRNWMLKLVTDLRTNQSVEPSSDVGQHAKNYMISNLPSMFVYNYVKNGDEAALYSKPNGRVLGRVDVKEDGKVLDVYFLQKEFKQYITVEQKLSFKTFVRDMRACGMELVDTTARIAMRHLITKEELGDEKQLAGACRVYKITFVNGGGDAAKEEPDQDAQV